MNKRILKRMHLERERWLRTFFDGAESTGGKLTDFDDKENLMSLAFNAGFIEGWETKDRAITRKEKSK